MSIETSGQPFFLWADTEFTGANVSDGHVVLEVAGVITDAALNEIDAYQSFVHQPKEVVRDMYNKNPFWVSHGSLAHALLDGIESAPVPSDVDVELQAFHDEYFDPQQALLAGNSIHGDLQHIRNAFPGFAARLHYRIFDLSSIADFLAIYHGIEYKGKKYPHRALPDVCESLDQARFLLRKTGIKAPLLLTN